MPGEEHPNWSEPYYRAIVENQRELIARFTPDTVLIYVNDAYCRYFGKAREELVGSSLLSLVSEADRSQTRDRLQSLCRSAPVVENEERVMLPTGEIRWQQWINRAVFDAGDRVVEIQSVGRDITERKRLEDALRQSEATFRTLLEACPDAVVMMDSEGRILFASSRAVELQGARSPEELCGHDAMRLVVEEDRRRARENLADLCARKNRRTDEYIAVRADGTRFACEITSAVVCDDPNGEPTAVMAVIRDVSRRKEAQKALQHRLEELQTIYDGTIEGILITDIATKRFVRVNASLCRMLGYSEDELLQKSVPDIHPPEVVPDDLQRFQAAAEGRVTINENRPVLCKDGSIFYADITGNRILHEGRPCLLALFRDITERKQAEEALQRERRTLEHMLRAGDHERQLIAYDIHDGLAQHLAAAMMQLQTAEHLRQHRPDQAKTAYDAGLQMLRQAHFEARRLISGVRPPILDESGIVAAIAHLVHEQQTAHGPSIELHSQVSFERLPPVLENAIYRIAQEALANASKHSRSEKVRLALVQEQDELRLEVQDWGVGFDPACVAENRFGLEGIRERTRLLGGKMKIRSRPGEGTLLRVVLPLIAHQPACDE
ncbi:MAG: PAS domain S-box protein [Rhodopirellula sp.]|nr:PAS domain S-box protein [Rhodopirellula sp.]